MAYARAIMENRPNHNPSDMLEAYADRLWESVETHQLSDMALAALSDMVVDCTISGRILRANPAFCAHAGVPLEQLEGRDGHEFAFLQNREQPRCTIELKTASGDAIWFDRIQLPMRDAQTGAQFVRIVGRDISEHKLSEIRLVEARKQAEAADEAKSGFLAMVSHEIRTPLNGIIGMGKLLADTKLSQEQQTYVEAVTTSSEALLVLVNDLLQFGKQELANTPKPEPIDVRPLVAGVMELMADRAHEKAIDLGYAFAADLPSIISVDVGQLRQMLFNIVGNAVKFTEQGGVRVDVAFSTPDQLHIKITDTGPGIPADSASKIFEPFEQVENTFTRSHDGAGLGLAISRKIARAMGGDIELVTKVGEGSEFLTTITAPMICEDDVLVPSLQGQQIIMVCRKGIEADILSETFASSGAQIECADNLQEAHALAQKGEGLKKVIVDQRLGFCESALQNINWPNGTELIAFIEPSSRGKIGAAYNAAGHSYLTRPLRPATGLRVLKNAPAPETIEKSEKPEREIVTGAGKILLAEDNPINALLARKMLEQASYEVTLVENGADALSVCENSCFMAVLTDLHMPVMDGLAFIKAMRKMEEDHNRKPTPIFAVTADSLSTTADTVLAAGATAILEKPLNIEALHQAMGSKKQISA